MRQEASPPLPPPPRDITSGGNRRARVGQVALALGAACVIGAVCVAGWYHCDEVHVTFATRQFDDSRYGQELAGDINSYSLAVWAFLRLDGGFPAPLLAAMLATATIALLSAGARWRTGAMLVVLGVVASLGWLTLDLRAMPETVAALATKTPSGSFPTSIRALGMGPGPAMLVALFGLLLQMNGAVLVVIGGRRLRLLRRPTEGKAESQQAAVDEFEAGGADERGVQRAAPLPQYQAQQGYDQRQAEPRQ